ncbi:MAG: hypothetical protein VYD71_02885 [Bacteroidota bacterium]|nr:hypothetical protein [Bacteroidota bacterium]
MKKGLVFLFCIFSFQLFSQEEKNALTAIIFDYTHQFPFADLKDNYGDNSSVGISLVKKSQNNYLFGIDASYIFGSKIKEDKLFDSISTENGEIINKDGLFSNILTYQRGFSTLINGGKAFLFAKDNHSGIYLTAGLGYMQHKIRIQTQEDIIPQLDENYKKGYDRLSGGFSMKLNANYMHFSKKNNIKFFIGVELIKGWTKNLRVYNFDQMTHTSDEFRSDILLGIKSGIIIPIFRKNREEFHYF